MSKYCGKCGMKLDDHAAFCSSCGAQQEMRSTSEGQHQQLSDSASRGWTPPGSNAATSATPVVTLDKTKVIIGASCIVFVVLLAVILSVSIFSGGSLQSKLLGTWSTNEGFDSDYYEFYKNGDYCRYGFDYKSEGTYKIKGNDFYFGDAKEPSYIYSKQAKELNSRDYWYIEDKVLYMGRTKYYKK